MSKKSLSLFLALSACSLLWSADFTVDDIAYKFLGGDSVTVASKSPNYSGSVTIPSTVTYESTTYRVTGIDRGAFKRCTYLTSITLPNSVTSIGENAFAFCSSLSTVNLPNRLTSLEYAVFDNCTSLGSITIPNSVTSIGEYTFFECTSLGSINIPSSVTSIGREAFSRCTSLVSITIPNSVTSIGIAVFSSCTSLTAIEVDAANTHYTAADGVLFNYAKNTLVQYPIGNTRTTYTIPNGVTRIDECAFAECTSLVSVTLPNGLITIDAVAFSQCTSLVSIAIPSSVISIGEESFLKCTSLTAIEVDAANTHYASIDGVLFDNTQKNLIQYPIGNTRTTYTVPNGVTSIDEDAFYCCSTLSSVTISNSVTSIGRDAFRSCSSLDSVTIGSSVTSIGREAFNQCITLSAISCYVTIPPVCSDSCFYNVDKSIPLYVPEESISAYQQAKHWKDFTNILPLRTSSLPVLTDSSIHPSAKILVDGQLLIQKNGNVYDASGKIVE